MARKNPWFLFNTNFCDWLAEMGIEPGDRQKLDALSRYSKALLRCAYDDCDPETAVDELPQSFYQVTEKIDAYANLATR